MLPSGGIESWDDKCWEADEPNAGDELAEEHEECVDNAAPDDVAGEHVGDGDGEADGGEEERFEDEVEGGGVVFLEDGAAG